MCSRGRLVPLRDVSLVLECAGGVQATWGAVGRTKDSETNARVSCTRSASNFAVKLAVERSVV